MMLRESKDVQLEWNASETYAMKTIISILRILGKQKKEHILAKWKKRWNKFQEKYLRVSQIKTEWIYPGLTEMLENLWIWVWWTRHVSKMLAHLERWTSLWEKPTSNNLAVEVLFGLRHLFLQKLWEVLGPSGVLKLVVSWIKYLKVRKER